MTTIESFRAEVVRELRYDTAEFLTEDLSREVIEKAMLDHKADIIDRERRRAGLPADSPDVATVSEEFEQIVKEVMDDKFGGTSCAV